MQKIKSWAQSDAGKDIMIIIIVILVGLGSFELGRLSKNSSQAGLKIEYRDQGAAVVNSIDLNDTEADLNQIEQVGSKDTSGKSFFASKKGKKYYPLGCSAGKSIKIENRVYFQTAQEAESAGYSLSSSC
jgi:hypothetical protein